MAAYLELYGLRSNSDLQDRVRVAGVVAAEAIRTEDAGTANHDNRLIWAAEVFSSPVGVTDRLLWAILAANKNASIAQITSAADSVLQSQVDAVVDLFATGVTSPPV